MSILEEEDERARLLEALRETPGGRALAEHPAVIEFLMSHIGSIGLLRKAWNEGPPHIHADARAGIIVRQLLLEARGRWPNWKWIRTSSLREILDGAARVLRIANGAVYLLERQEKTN